MLTAHTRQIDNVDLAVAEIMEQVRPECLCADSVGIVACHEDFFTSGVVSALCAALPFDIVGCVTFASAVRGACGSLALTLSVMTGDDVRFATDAVFPVRAGEGARVEELCSRLFAALPEPPALLMVFLPFLPDSSDEFVRALRAAAGGVPLVGLRAICGMESQDRAYVTHNRRYGADGLALLAVSGKVNPSFLSVPAPKDRALGLQAVVTASESNMLRRINNLTALEYFSSIGFAEGREIMGQEIIPLILDRRDGGSTFCRIYQGAATPEGGIACGGEVPVGATLDFVALDRQFVLQSVKGLMEEALASARGRNFLIISCSVRGWTLGIQPDEEMRALAALLKDGPPYHFVYSGGEVYPDPGDAGRGSFLDNAALVVCLL
jgi:hypothetical protein